MFHRVDTPENMIIRVKSPINYIRRTRPISLKSLTIVCIHDYFTILPIPDHMDAWIGLGWAGMCWASKAGPIRGWTGLDWLEAGLAWPGIRAEWSHGSGATGRCWLHGLGCLQSEQKKKANCMLTTLIFFKCKYEKT